MEEKKASPEALEECRKMVSGAGSLIVPFLRAVDGIGMGLREMEVFQESVGYRTGRELQELIVQEAGRDSLSLEQEETLRAWVQSKLNNGQ